MYLTVDAGNSNVVLNGYQGSRSLFCERLVTRHEGTAQEYALQFRQVLAHHPDAQPQGAIVSSVVPSITDALLQAARAVTSCEPLLFSRELACGVEIRSDRPEELGMDLLAGAVGVRALGLPLPAVIVDLGTATKLTALNGDGAVIGVSIIPGVRLSLNALLNGTSLPGGDVLEAPPHAIGTNTLDSMRSGLVLGTACLLDGLLDRFEAELGGAVTVVATGGLAERIVPSCRRRFVLLPNLVPDGLAAAYRRAKGLE